MLDFFFLKGRGGNVNALAPRKSCRNQSCFGLTTEEGACTTSCMEMMPSVVPNPWGRCPHIHAVPWPSARLGHKSNNKTLTHLAAGLHRKISFQGKELEGQGQPVVGRTHLGSSRIEGEIPQTQALLLNTGIKHVHATYILKEGWGRHTAYTPLYPKRYLTCPFLARGGFIYLLQSGLKLWQHSRVQISYNTTWKI